MALVGNLKDLKLPNLVQLNCMERNTAKLTIEHSGKFGFLYFLNGQVAHAEYEPDMGEKAFNRLLFLNEGNFKVESGVKPPVVSIKTHWNNLLLEGLHKVDTIQEASENPAQRIVNMLMNVKGVQKAAVISREGEVVASTFEVKDKSSLIAFSYLEVKKLTDIILMEEPEFFSVQKQNMKTLMTKFNNDIAYMELDSKIQFESIIPFVKKALS
jgi:predicted regulator of Ras-like GTPase activity (Roadblock/LC7/MglB family)